MQWSKVSKIACPGNDFASDMCRELKILGENPDFTWVPHIDFCLD